LDHSEFICRWIDKKELWEVADDIRGKYWPEDTLPVNAEKIVEFRLKLIIDPKHNLLHKGAASLFLNRPFRALNGRFKALFNLGFQRIRI